MEVTVRPARPGDAEQVAQIYRHYIESSHITFDAKPWTAEKTAEWFDGFRDDGPHRVFVAEVEQQLVGAARSSPWRTKGGYAQTVETTVVVHPGYTGEGIGRSLLSSLLDELADSGVHRAYAVIALPNDESIALHERLGYRRVGVQNESGYKFGQYWSTLIMEKRIG